MTRGGPRHFSARSSPRRSAAAVRSGVRSSGLALLLAIAATPVLMAIVAPPRAAAIGSLCDSFPCYTLTFVPFGNGSGTIETTDANYTAPDGAIDCLVTAGVASKKCSNTYVDLTYSGVSIYFLIIPATGNAACDSVTRCFDATLNSSLVLVANRQEQYGFAIDTEHLTVTKSGPGTGTVTMDPWHLVCGPACYGSYDYGSLATLTATADSGAVFTAWTGACAGQGAVCSLTITADTSTNAVFGLASPAPTASTPTAKPSTPPPMATGPSPSGTPTVSEPAATESSEASAPPDPDGTSPAAAATAALEPTPVPPAGEAVRVAPVDLSPIALAILGAGLLIGTGIAVAALVWRRRPRGGS
jgi:hypothetical protein